MHLAFPGLLIIPLTKIAGQARCLSHNNYFLLWDGHPACPTIIIFCCGMGILPVPKLEQRTSNSSQKFKQKQQCDYHKPKHDFVNDIAPPLPKQPFLNLYLYEPNQTLHRGDSHAQHLAQ